MFHTECNNTNGWRQLWKLSKYLRMRLKNQQQRAEKHKQTNQQTKNKILNNIHNCSTSTSTCSLNWITCTWTVHENKQQIRSSNENMHHFFLSFRPEIGWVVLTFFHCTTIFLWNAWNENQILRHYSWIYGFRLLQVFWCGRQLIKCKTESWLFSLFVSALMQLMEWNFKRESNKSQPL